MFRLLYLHPVSRSCVLEQACLHSFPAFFSFQTCSATEPGAPFRLCRSGVLLWCDRLVLFVHLSASSVLCSSSCSVLIAGLSDSL